MSTPIRLGTRRSALAQAQSGHVATALETVTGRRVELVPITSEGDTNRASLSEIGGLGIFATRLREALLAESATSWCTPSKTCRPPCRNPS